MTDRPEEEARIPGMGAENEAAGSAAPPANGADEQTGDGIPFAPVSIAPFGNDPEPRTPELNLASFAVPDAPLAEPPIPEPPLLFQSFAQPPARKQVRIPHFGHLSLLIPVGLFAFACTIAVLLVPMRKHLFGWSVSAQANATNVSLILASEALLYFFTFAICLAVFPLFWHEGLFKGLQWRGDVARQRFWLLAATSLGCAGVAALDNWLMPGPVNAPIDKMFSTTAAAWLMFVFGTTIAPFFEEMFFRGFLLPALCTAWDWMVESFTHEPARPLDAHGHPQWSLAAMAVGSILTSIPFALLHAQQQGHSLGPFLLMIAISMILCGVRLRTRSLASSTLVHACYNFIIFSIALIGTGGFRHFDKM